MTTEQIQKVSDKIEELEADFETLNKGLITNNQNIISAIWRHIGFLKGSMDVFRESVE